MQQHANCGERWNGWCNCRSYGVLLWELITHEVPYKDVDTSAVIWGVGSNSLSLPVPASCPDGIKLLMQLCWSVLSYQQSEISTVVAQSPKCDITAMVVYFALLRVVFDEGNSGYVTILIHVCWSSAVWFAWLSANIIIWRQLKSKWAWSSLYVQH